MRESMTSVILLVVFGFGCGYYYTRNHSKPVVEMKQRLEARERQNALLTEEIATLRRTDARERDERERNRQRYAQNNIADTSNQIRFITEAELYVSRPVNKEAVLVLYALDDWIKHNQPGWRMSFEVGMGAFIKTKYSSDDQGQKAAFSSYNSKRVDFLLIDEKGFPKLAVEYHGSGHDLSDDATDRMHVKRLALSRVGIPLVEVPERTDKQSIKRMVTEALLPTA
jgi:hypothetical protein